MMVGQWSESCGCQNIRTKKTPWSTRSNRDALPENELGFAVALLAKASLPFSGIYFLNMGGFFLDSIIRSIARSVRGERRVENAQLWPTVDGKISRFTVGNKSGGDGHPLLTFSYEINGEMFYGSAVGTSIDLKQINQVTDAINGIGIVHVRYDPFDLGSSRLLNRDNPEFPFEIDQTAN
jgi:hypothetical protein